MSAPQEPYWQPAAQIARLVVNALEYQDFGSIRGVDSVEVVDFTTIRIEHEDCQFLVRVEQEEQR